MKPAFNYSELYFKKFVIFSFSRKVYDCMCEKCVGVCVCVCIYVYPFKKYISDI